MLILDWFDQAFDSEARHSHFRFAAASWLAAVFIRGDYKQRSAALRICATGALDFEQAPRAI
jgi:hypothetical protein